MRKSAKQRDEERERRVLEVCYVCEKKISGIPEPIGKGLFRHHLCRPGSARWMTSQRAKDSAITEFFECGNQ
jgi:hypothetical protein